MVVTAESVQERGLSAGMTETEAAQVETVTEAAQVETVGAVMREKRGRPDDETNFESVHKYCKDTKDSRPGLNAGMGMVCPVTGVKLEARHALACAASPVAPPATAVRVPGMVGVGRPLPELPPVGATAGMGTPMVGGNLSFWTSDQEDSDNEGTDDMGERGKGTLEGSGGNGVRSGYTMRFFEGLTKQAMEQQDAMQQRFVEAIEKREQDRMTHEEAWRREGIARLAREQEILARERAMAATRGAAVLSFLQKITRQTIPIAAPAITFMPPSSQTQATPIAYATPPPPSWQPPACTRLQPSSGPPKMAPATPQPQPQQKEALVVHQVRSFMTPAETPRDGAGGGGRGGASSSPRWTKTEVHALIQLRSNLLDRRQGPLWEEISSGMRRMGYSRSSKRCREKWNSMNKYFNKVKQSNKNSKTCSYFHHLDALHRIKAALELDYPSGAALPPLAAVHSNAAPQDRIESFTVALPISQRAPPPVAKNDVRLYQYHGRPTRQQLGIFDNIEVEAATAYGAAAKTNFEQEQPPTGTTAGNGEESSTDLLNDLLVW